MDFRSGGGAGTETMDTSVASARGHAGTELKAGNERKDGGAGTASNYWPGV